MTALHAVGYPTPEPVGHSRHIVAMTLVRGCPLYQIRARSEISVQQAEAIYEQSVSLAARLAKHGLVHCDLNEFNLMVDLSGVQAKLNPGNDAGGHYVRNSGAVMRGPGALSHHAVLGKDTGPDGTSLIDGTGEVVTEEAVQPVAVLGDGKPVPIVTLIDFPQMVSTKHPNARELYERDVNCLVKFFSNKLNCVSGDGDDDMKAGWTWADVTGEQKEKKESGSAGEDAEGRLDGELKASGFSDENSRRDLELYYFEKHTVEEDEESGDDEEGGEEEDEEEEDDDEEEREEGEEGDGAASNLVEPLMKAGLDSAQMDAIRDAGKGASSSAKSVASSRMSHMSSAQRKAADKVMTMQTDGVMKKKINQQMPKGRGGAVYKLGNSSKKLIKGKKAHKDKIKVSGDAFGAY